MAQNSLKPQTVGSCIKKSFIAGAASAGLSIFFGFICIVVAGYIRNFAFQNGKIVFYATDYLSYWLTTGEYYEVILCFCAIIGVPWVLRICVNYYDWSMGEGMAITKKAHHGWGIFTFVIGFINFIVMFTALFPNPHWYAWPIAAILACFAGFVSFWIFGKAK